MTDLLCACGILIAASFAMLVIRDTSRMTAAVLGAALCVSVFVFAVRRLAPAVEQITSALPDSDLADVTSPLVKGLGIACLTSFTSSTLRDLDSPNAAKYAELIGRTELVLLALPLTAELVGIAASLSQ